MRCSRMCVTLLAVSAIACGKAATTPTADDTESQGAQEALASTEESGNAGSGEAQAPGAALMASPACVDANTTLVAGLSLLDPNAEVRIDLTYNACGIARGVHVSGTTSLDVTLSPSGRTVVLTADVTQTNRTGGTLQVTTDPNIKVASAGVRGPNATVTRTITGADHRVRKNAQGTVVHDMEITHNGTTVADSFDGAGTWSGRTLNGSATVRHNLAKSTATITFDNLKRDSTCCYPTSGTLTQSVAHDGGDTTERTYTFGSVCGNVSIKTDNVTADVTFDPC